MVIFLRSRSSRFCFCRKVLHISYRTTRLAYKGLKAFRFLPWHEKCVYMVNNRTNKPASRGRGRTRFPALMGERHLGRRLNMRRGAWTFAFILIVLLAVAPPGVLAAAYPFTSINA